MDVHVTNVVQGTVRRQPSGISGWSDMPGGAATADGAAVDWLCREAVLVLPGDTSHGTSIGHSHQQQHIFLSADRPRGYADIDTS